MLKRKTVSIIVISHFNRKQETSFILSLYCLRQFHLRKTIPLIRRLVGKMKQHWFSFFPHHFQLLLNKIRIVKIKQNNQNNITIVLSLLPLGQRASLLTAYYKVDSPSSMFLSGNTCASIQLTLTVPMRLGVQENWCKLDVFVICCARTNNKVLCL